MKKRTSDTRLPHARHEEPRRGRTTEHPVQQSPTMSSQRDEIRGRFGDAAQLAEAEVEPNRTGLPDNLKAGIENLSGIAMDNVRVHFNSAEPARIDAAAYAQGTSIHLAPGQEQHLPHEAWHVVQQAQDRVAPTRQHRGVAVNDQESLEVEATVMGDKALHALPRGGDYAAAAAHGDSMAPKQLAEPSNGTMQLQLDYSKARAICESVSLSDKKHFALLGTGANKQAFEVKDDKGESTGWVLLLMKKGGSGGVDTGAATKKDLLQSELDMLAGYREAKLPVPATSGTDAEGDVFLSKDGRPAFLQEFVPGFEPARKEGLYYDSTAMTAFEDELWGSWCGEPSWPEAQKKAVRSIECLMKIQGYLDKHSMPDLQFRYKETSGDILVMDPGTPSGYGGNPDSYNRWINGLIKLAKQFSERDWDLSHKKQGK